MLRQQTSHHLVPYNAYIYIYIYIYPIIPYIYNVPSITLSLFNVSSNMRRSGGVEHERGEVVGEFLYLRNEGRGVGGTVSEELRHQRGEATQHSNNRWGVRQGELWAPNRETLAKKLILGEIFKLLKESK